MFDFKCSIDAINNFRKKNKKPITNYIVTSNELLKYSNMSSSVFVNTEHSIFLFVNDVYVNRVYFYVDDIQNIEDLGRHIHCNSNNLPTIIEHITKQQSDAEFKELLENIGINYYTRQFRWRAAKLNNVIPRNRLNNTFERAVLSDAYQIAHILEDTFDVRVSHLPSKDDLDNYIKNQIVFVAKKDDDIIAVWIGENKGNNGVYFYQNAVSKDYQGSGIGILLFHYAIGEFVEKKDFSAWVEESNTASANMHKYIGMKPDGLINYIYVYEKEGKK